MFDLTGKVAMVTGAAGGIAQAMGVALAEAGADVIGIDLKEMSETRQMVEKLGRKFLPLIQNLAYVDEIPKLVEKGVDEMGHVDILINCAGMSDTGFEPQTLPWQEYRTVMEINLNAMVRLSQEVYRRMVAQGRGGRIINITSILALYPSEGALAYGTSKNGIIGLTKVMAVAGGKHGISVNAIAPGSIVTAMLLGMYGGRDDAELDEDGEVIYQAPYMPTLRMGTPKDLKGLAIFLASDESEYFTGQVICCDGGIQNRHKYEEFDVFE